MSLASPPAADVAFYVYFKSRADDVAVAAALARFCARLQADGWPAPTVWRRPENPDGRRTWMEVHSPQPAQRTAKHLEDLSAAASISGLSALVDGERHVERFERVPVPLAGGTPS